MVFVYSHDRKQKYKLICTKSASHRYLGLYLVPLAAAMEKPRGTGFYREVGGVLKRIGAELAADMEVEVTGGEAAWFLGIRASIQKVDHGNISPRRRHRL